LRLLEDRCFTPGCNAVRTSSAGIDEKSGSPQSPNSKVVTCTYL
jgi:hypothetical protein